MVYEHLTQNERYQIQILFAEGFDPTSRRRTSRL